MTSCRFRCNCLLEEDTETDGCIQQFKELRRITGCLIGRMMSVFNQRDTETISRHTLPTPFRVWSTTSSYGPGLTGVLSVQ
uniref:Uncharacterized protein n=1 Tax=Arion vulgaris TaxID=1028688 RepID=A0A0B7B9Y4_9EUPU